MIKRSWECGAKVVDGDRTRKCGLPPSRHTVTGRTTHTVPDNRPAHVNPVSRVLSVYAVSHPFVVS